MQERLWFMSSANWSHCFARSDRFFSTWVIICGSGSRCSTCSQSVSASSNLILNSGKLDSHKERLLSTPESFVSMVFWTAENKFSTSRSFRFSCSEIKRNNIFSFASHDDELQIPRIPARNSWLLHPESGGDRIFSSKFPRRLQKRMEKIDFGRLVCIL